METCDKLEHVAAAPKCVPSVGSHLERIHTGQPGRVRDKALVQEDVSVLNTAQRNFVLNLAGAEPLGPLAHYKGIHLQPNPTLMFSLFMLAFAPITTAQHDVFLAS